MLTRHIREYLQVTPGPFPDFWVGPGDEAMVACLSVVRQTCKYSWLRNYQLLNINENFVDLQLGLSYSPDPSLSLLAPPIQEGSGNQTRESLERGLLRLNTVYMYNKFTSSTAFYKHKPCLVTPKTRSYKVTTKTLSDEVYTLLRTFRGWQSIVRTTMTTQPCTVPNTKQLS